MEKSKYKINLLFIAMGLGWSSISFAFAEPDTTKQIQAAAISGSITSELIPDTILLKHHISTLADDAMEGRETGTKGEAMACEYIAGEFKNLGLIPMGTEGYRQPFPFNAGSYMGPSNKLKINKLTLVPGEQFYPLAYSANSTFEGSGIFVGYGIAAPGRDDYQKLSGFKGKVFVMESGYPEGMDPHSRLAEYADLKTRIDSAVSRGAIAIIFINSDTTSENPSKNYSNRITPASIPVFFVQKDAARFLKGPQEFMISGQAEILKNEKTGNNVIGFIDNKAPFTVVLGAHYDHLGYGIEGSLYRGEAKLIHNGADDNASGTAALIELARLIKLSGYQGANYMFIAFSGEEMGLLGSNNLVKHFPIPLEKISCMLNMDMVGRLKPEDPVLIVNGAGTSPEWNKIMALIHVDGLKIKTSDSGLGPSDHTSFYLKDIPVLHFFSGTHSDYHKPDDDEYKINYKGEQDIIIYMMEIVRLLNDKGKIAFTKTIDSNNEDAPKFKVTLGVVPDYAFDGSGMRIDGVSEGKPAQKAGILAGDIVVQIGEHKVTDMMSYMKALGKFSKGEKANVSIMRGKELLVKEIVF